MLKFTKKSQLKKEQEEKRLEKISKIVQEVSDFERKNSVKITIKKFSEKKSLTKEESKILDALLAKSEAEQNDLKPESEPSVSLVPTELNHGTNQKIQVKPFPTPSGEGVTDELAKKIAKRRALLDGQDNINTSNVSYSKEAEQSLKVKSINQKNIQNQHSQTLKQALNSDNSVPINHGLNVTEELARILAERNKISERNNNDTAEKEKVISSITSVSPDQQSKLSERAADEGQFMQKNVDIDLKQNSDEDSFLLQQIKAARKQLTNNQTTVQEDNLPSWAKSEFIDSASEKKLLEEKKEQNFFDFSESVCARTDLSEEERQEIINFHEQVYDVKLRFRDEACKKHFEGTVSKIYEEITRPNSILDDEFSTNLKIINDFIKENDAQQQLQTPVSLQFKPQNKNEAMIIEMNPKPNFK